MKGAGVAGKVGNGKEREIKRSIMRLSQLS